MPFRSLAVLGATLAPLPCRAPSVTAVASWAVAGAAQLLPAAVLPSPACGPVLAVTPGARRCHPLRRLGMALRKRVAAPPGHLQGECRAADRGSLWHHPSGHGRALAPPGAGAATRESPAPTPWGSRGHPRGCPGPLATGIPASRHPAAAPQGPEQGGIPLAVPEPSRWPPSGGGSRGGGCGEPADPSPSRGRGGAAGREPGRAGRRAAAARERSPETKAAPGGGGGAAHRARTGPPPPPPDGAAARRLSHVRRRRR